MKLRRFATIVALASAVALAGCNSSDVLDVARKANQPLPRDVVLTMKANGMTKYSPIMMRIFKEEAVLEVWKRKDTGRYALVKSYEICNFSGEKGPKFKEGDRQAPEGFYLVNRHLMNPNSSYYLSFNLGFPNKYDRSHGRTGSNLMVHGDCTSAGCYAMTDENVAEIYAFARDALSGGQKDFQVQAFPFRMTTENMAMHRNDEHFAYWEMLKEGYDHFELTKLPPKIDVCDRQYVFNRNALEGEFEPSASCPKSEMPYSLAVAYTSHKNKYALEFEGIVAQLEGREPNDIQLLPIPAPPPPELEVESETKSELEVDNAQVAPPVQNSSSILNLPPAPARIIATSSGTGSAIIKMSSETDTAQ